MSSAFVSKSRRVRFELHVRIIDLNNVPLVSGTSFVKWHLPSSTAAEHRGRTPKSPIRDHRVEYAHERTVAVRLTVAKDGTLQECAVHFEVLQEYSAGGRAERLRLGEVTLNLAEYVGASEAPRDDPDAGVVRRYLMQDSKINSTLKIGIHMRHVDGTRDYIAPPLRTAPVFGGIAGIISSSEPVSTTHGVLSRAVDADSLHDADGGAAAVNLPSLNRSTRELGEMQDMYRRTLAAYLFSQPGELKADEAIEDIFAGGDGWGRAARPDSAGRTSAEGTEMTGARESEAKMSSPAGVSGPMETGGRHHREGHHHHHHHHQHHRKHESKERIVRRGQGEVDEFDIRDDLKSWGVGEAAVS